MNKIKSIKNQADKVIVYLSPEYLTLNKTVQSFAEPNILMNGYYAITVTDGEKKQKLFITR
jgi:hypothetical protein